MKKLFIAGNWKMHFTRSEAVSLAKDLVSFSQGISHEIMIAVPYTSLESVSAVVKGSKIKLGAQNVSWADKGAFTGEISAEMLKDLSVEYVIIGHSERRQYFGETNLSVNKRVIKALESELKVILCVGETLEERENQTYRNVVSQQLKEGLKGINKDKIQSLTIAYEPVWAIGTGRTASSDQAQEMHSFIRSCMANDFGKDIAESLFIQYGGSVNSENIKELVSQKDINGVLVGGASLKADSFSSLWIF